MSIRETIMQRKQRVERVKIDDLGEVSILKIDGGTLMELSMLKPADAGVALIAKCVMDDDGRPIFNSADEVKSIEWVLVEKLLNACNEVNNLQSKIEAASKN